MTDASEAAAYPNAAAVATRAVVVGALCVRSFLEHAGASQPEEAELERIRLLQWLNDEGLAEAVTPEETPVFESPVGDLTPEQTITAAWRLEALAVLLWALGQRDGVPPYDEEADAEALLRLLPGIGQPSEAFRVMAGLRPAAALLVERDRARLWHWRARTQLLLDQGFEDPDLDLAAAVQRSAAAAVRRGELPGLLDGDFPACGRPYHELSDEQYGAVASIAAIRHLALAWLCGAGEWDRAGLDT